MYMKGQPSPSTLSMLSAVVISTDRPNAPPRTENKKKYGWVISLHEYPMTIRTLWIETRSELSAPVFVLFDGAKKKATSPRQNGWTLIVT